MAFRTIRVAVLFASLLMAGCGTVGNLVTPGPAGGKTPFGGVRQDVTCMKKAAAGEHHFGAHAATELKQPPQVIPWLVSAADLPFTFVGDVVTWPYTASYTFINQPIPLPPLTYAPPPPVTPALAVGLTQTPPTESLPEPRTVP